jgi:hypothetical protein
MSKIKAFYGKQISTSSYALGMMLWSKGLVNIPYIHCFTTEVFTRVCYIHKPDQWIASYPQGQQGIMAAVENLGLNNAFECVELTSKTHEELLLYMREWASRGPFILGTLDPTPIWDRIESRYCKGFSQYIVVLKYEFENTFIVHDPQGCPYFHIGADKIFQALKSSNNKYSMFRLSSLTGLYSEEKIYEQIIINAIKNRKETLSLSEHICEGLKQLVSMLCNRALKSSEVAALTFSVAEMGIALFNMTKFLSSPPICIKRKKLFDEAIIGEIIDTLSGYEKTIAKLLTNLRQIDNKEIIPCLKEIAVAEQKLDHYFLALCS